MVDWSEDHMTVIAPLNLNFGTFGKVWLTGDRAGPLVSCSLHLCRLRTDGLATTSKY
jgi:hypothetical protein